MLTIPRIDKEYDHWYHEDALEVNATEATQD